MENAHAFIFPFLFFSQAPTLSNLKACLLKGAWLCTTEGEDQKEGRVRKKPRKKTEEAES